MSAQSESPLENEVNQSRLEFFKTEFKLCSTFLDLADTRIKVGNQESAQTAIGNAEKAYETLIRFLADSKHISHLTPDQLREFKAELQPLRERLDGFQSKL